MANAGSRFLVWGFFAATLLSASLIPRTVVSGSSSNDAFSSRYVVSALPFQHTINTTTATIQTGEPQPCIRSERTVWYAFVAAESGPHEIDTFGSDFDTVIASYTGSDVAALTVVECNDDTLASTRSRIQFQAVAGTTYAIQAGGVGDRAGTLTLNIRESPPPPTNDAFSQSAQVTGVPFGDARYNSSAAEDPGEPKTTCSDVEKTVWYTFAPQEAGEYAIDTAGSEFDTVLTVFTGSQLDGLVQLACNDDINAGLILQSRVQLTMNAGTTYRIQAGGFSGFRGGAEAESGRLVLSISKPMPEDSDGDGCGDAFESGALASGGGDRSPYFYWDWFDVTGDGLIDLRDVLLVLSHSGHGASDDSMDARLDRVTVDPSRPWRTAPPLAPSDSISLEDALTSLASFGHACGVSPLPTPISTITPALSTSTPTPISGTLTPTRTGTATANAPTTLTATQTPTPDCVDTDGDGLCNNVDLDDDGDGVDDESELLVYGTSPLLLDTDDDGCSDNEEIGANPRLGGGRDPLEPSDFGDLDGDKLVSIVDLTIEAQQYLRIPLPPARDFDDDRLVTILDLSMLAKQFGDSCQAPP